MPLKRRSPCQSPPSRWRPCFLSHRPLREARPCSRGHHTAARVDPPLGPQTGRTRVQLLIDPHPCSHRAPGQRRAGLGERRGCHGESDGGHWYVSLAPGSGASQEAGAGQQWGLTPFHISYVSHRDPPRSHLPRGGDSGGAGWEQETKVPGRGSHSHAHLLHACAHTRAHTYSGHAHSRSVTHAHSRTFPCSEHTHTCTLTPGVHMHSHAGTHVHTCLGK